MLRKILLIVNVCCLLILIFYFLLAIGVNWDNVTKTYLMIALLIVIIFALNVFFISKTGNKLKKLQSQVSSLKKIKESKKMNVKEFLLIIGNVGILVLFFSIISFIWPLPVNIVTIIFLAITILPLLNIFLLKPHLPLVFLYLLKEKI